MGKLESFFFPATKSISSIDNRLTRLQIKFLLISIAFGIGYWVNSYLTGFLAARYLMIVVSVCFLFQLLGLKYGFSIRTTAHIFTTICWLVIFLLTFFSGGIKSYVLGWISLVPVMSLILLPNRAAWIWACIGLLTVVFYFFVTPDELVSSVYIFDTNNLLTASLHVGLQFLLLTLVYIFYGQQKILIRTIEDTNEVLKISKEEIAAQNEELSQSQEEISTQRDLVANQNESLREARLIIENQNVELTLKNESLEIEIQKRTAELVEYNQQLEQFAFMSSHNLRAPIARILGLSNILEITQDEKEEKFIRKNLVVSAQELDRIVKELNTILEIRKNNTAQLVDINLQQELGLILINLEKEVLETKASIVSDFSAANEIRTARPYLDSILINLLSNAIKYRHENRAPRIQIKTSLLDDLLCLTVSDNGMGIDLSKYRAKLFTLYSRFHSHVEGKGLGLYLVKIQVESLGGKIEVESELDKGTTFTIYFKRN
jgi:signal transduction histidine kinase